MAIIEVGDDEVQLTDCDMVRETDKAMCVLVDGEDMWLPKSQIVDADDLLSDRHITITRWIAVQKNLVEEE